MGHGLESPTHRVSLGLLMNYYVHRKQYEQVPWNTCVSHETNNICPLKQFETWHSRDKANDVE